MEILLVRHAVAEEATGGMSDFQRQLTPKGRKQFRNLAEWLVERGLGPDAIYTSPLTRAAQTAEILRDEAGLDEDACKIHDALAPGMSAEGLLAVIRAGNTNRPAAIGHEPDFSLCLRELIAGGSVQFAKGGVACVEFDGQPELAQGRLRWFVTPKMLGT